MRWINERLKVEYNHNTGGGQQPSVMTGSERVEQISLAIGIYQERFGTRGKDSLGLKLTLSRTVAIKEQPLPLEQENHLAQSRNEAANWRGRASDLLKVE